MNKSFAVSWRKVLKVEMIESYFHLQLHPSCLILPPCNYTAGLLSIYTLYP